VKEEGKKKSIYFWPRGDRKREEKGKKRSSLYICL